MRTNNFLCPLTAAAACGLLVAAPVGARTIDIDASANGSTITTQNAGSPGPSFGATVGGFSVTVASAIDLGRIDLSDPTTDVKNASGTPNSWATVSKAGLGAVNSTLTFQSGSTENDMTSGSSVAAKAGERQADRNVEATAAPEPWTWVMISLGGVAVGMLRLIKPRRKQPRYII